MQEFNLITQEIYQLISDIGCYKTLDFNDPCTLSKNDIVIFCSPTKKELAMFNNWILKIKLNSLIIPNIYPVIDVKKSQKFYIMDFYNEPETIFKKLKSK